MEPVVTFIADQTGLHITADDWHNVRLMAEIHEGGKLRKGFVSDVSARYVVSELIDAIASQERYGKGLREDGLHVSWGYSDDDIRDLLNPAELAYEDAAVALLDKLKDMQITEGTAAALRQLRAHGPRTAVRMAKAMKENPYKPEPVTPPKDLRYMVDDLTRASDDISFESAHWIHQNGDEVTLGDMRSPDFAGNNCFNATLHAWDAIEDDGMLPEGWTHGRVEAMYMDDSPGQSGSGVHWANVFTSPDGEQWVVDYTARQFGGDTPWPLIARYEHWLKHVTSRTKAIWGSDLTTVWLHRDFSGDGEVLFNITAR